jgi:hypothetical protein
LDRFAMFLPVLFLNMGCKSDCGFPFALDEAKETVQSNLGNVFREN